MPEREPEELGFFRRFHAGGGGSDGNALHADHLAHHATGGIGSSGENWVQADLPGRRRLQVAKDKIAGSIRAGQEHAHPAQ